jgi:hypothetical protein
MRMKKGFIISSLIAAAGTAGVLTAKDKIKKTMADDTKKRELIDKGNDLVQKIVGHFSDKVPDDTIPYLNRYDSDNFLEGSGYFLTEPNKKAKWKLGFAKHSIIPDSVNGDLYVGGYLAYPPNKVTGIINDQLIRAVAVDDNSGRGINVFAVIDCIGISNTDIKHIRSLLKKEIEEYNIVSINISATHCHSGIDTQGMWGSITQAIKVNKKALNEGKPEDTVSGRNKEFMEYLFLTAADTIREAIKNMTVGKLEFKLLDASDFVRDKRPPYVVDDKLTVIRFTPATKGKSTLAVFLAAHPTCYGDKQREVSADYPYYLCDELENGGYNSMFFQGAEAAVATERGSKNVPEGLSRHKGIEAYGRVIGKYVLDGIKSDMTQIEPMLNVSLVEAFVPSDNKILELAAKMRLVNNATTKVTMDDERDSKNYDLYFGTEVGYVEFGKTLRFALIPGELCPELLVGGEYNKDDAYWGKDWKYPPMRQKFDGHLTVIGLCNDAIGYIVPDNDFGSVFAKDHYEEAVSAGGRTASNIVGAFFRAVDNGNKSRITGSQIISENK